MMYKYIQAVLRVRYSYTGTLPARADLNGWPLIHAWRTVSRCAGVELEEPDDDPPMLNVFQNNFNIVHLCVSFY